jgi:two-component system, LytTR family, sensor kinase
MNVNKYHIYFWVSFFGFFMLLDYLQYPEYFYIGRQLYIPVVQLASFYSLLYVILHFKTDSVRAWLKSIGLLILSFGLVLFLNYWRGRIAKYYGVIMHDSVAKLLYDTIRQYCGLAFYVIGYYYITRYATKQKELRQVEQQKAAADITQAEMKQNMLQLENDFLRAQINPHFLYNTLNVFYAKAMDTNPDLADGLVKLAEVMRYSLEATDSKQLAPLQTEVGHLERVIAIHRLRFEDDINIEFTIEGPYGLVSIAPLILITLLENALKHGDVESGASPIRLWLCVDAQRIYFTIQNQKNAQPIAEESSGIGLANVRKRLTNVYDDSYTLEIDETNGTYHVALVIAHGANLLANTVAHSAQPIT